MTNYVYMFLLKHTDVPSRSDELRGRRINITVRFVASTKGITRTIHAVKPDDVALAADGADKGDVPVSCGSIPAHVKLPPAWVVVHTHLNEQHKVVMRLKLVGPTDTRDSSGTNKEYPNAKNLSA